MELRVSFGEGGSERRQISDVRCLVSVETGDVGKKNEKNPIISGLLRVRMGCLSDMRAVSVSQEQQL